MIIDTNKYIYETSPFIKIFGDKVTVNIYYSMHCVMVIRTAHHCVMGHEIAWMWQSAGHRPTEKLDKKCLFHEKKLVDRMTFAVRTTSRLYVTSTHILLENNF